MIKDDALVEYNLVHGNYYGTPKSFVEDMLKQGKRDIRRAFSPRRVSVIRFEGRGVDETMLHQIAGFAFVYLALVLLGGLLVSLDGLYDIETNFSAALTCLSNVGPGFGAVGPSGNFAATWRT